MHNARVDLASIDTALFDLDGTLLDLAYDNYLWLERIPHDWASQNGVARDAALRSLAPRFTAVEGTLDWYDIEYWSRELGIDIAALHREEAARIAWLPGARELLIALRGLGKRLVLLTNSHPVTLAIKDDATSVRDYFDAAWSSQAFGAPKEDPRFWQGVRAALHFDPARTLFIDDSLPVLRAARAGGIAHLLAVYRPDTRQPDKDVGEFAALRHFADIMPGLAG